MVKFCPQCKKIHPTSAVICPSCRNPALMLFCEKCKRMVPRGEIACPSCGDVDTTQIQKTSRTSKPPKKKKRRLLPVFLSLTVLVIAGVSVWWFLFSKVERVTLDPEKLELIEGETVNIEYVLSPKWAFPRDLEWSSTSESVAEVDRSGNVTAVKKGKCTISLIADGISGDCKITVKRDGFDLAEVYWSIDGEGYYCELASDESYILIDTNPENVKEGYWSELKDIPWTYKEEAKGLEYVLKANKELELPKSVSTKMGQTRALDGRQTETCGDITVSWTYHPDHGLEVIYERTSK